MKRLENTFRNSSRTNVTNAMSTDLLRNPLVNEGRTLIDDLLGILFPFFYGYLSRRTIRLLTNSLSLPLIPTYQRFVIDQAKPPDSLPRERNGIPR
jgi:hypothetical protein